MPNRSHWSARRCLVIGGAGNLGGQLVETLLDLGASVACFDVVEYTARGRAVASTVGSVLDQRALEKACDGVSVVFHTASVIDIRPLPSPRMQEVNVAGTYAVVMACKAARVPTLVYTSSLEVVSGDGASLDGVDESAPIPTRHHLPYAATKATAERLVLCAHSAELRTVAIRSGYLMGPGAIGLRVEMQRAATRGGYYVTAKVPATISTTHPRNCALAHVHAAERAARADVGGHAFFVRDFEANVVEMALEAFEGTPIKPAIMPLAVAYGLAWLLDRLERLLHLLYAWAGRTRHTADEVLDIKAVGMAYIDIVVSDAAGRRALEYEPLVSRAECMREAKEWCKGYYAALLRK